MTTTKKMFRLTKAEKAAEAERDAMIASLGWAPEEKTLDGRYCATTGELRSMVEEKKKS